MNRSLLLFAIVATLTALLTQPAFAAQSGGTIFVTSRTDGPDVNPGDGDCSDSNGDCGLRAAVMEANALAGADEIIFVVPGTNAFNVSTQINVTDDVTITGATPAITRIDGGDQARLFHVTNARLTLENMTLRNGNAGVSNGGAILTNNSSENSIVLDNVVVKDNDANNGGGLYVLGNLTIQNSVIEGNSANFDGGGISSSLSGRITIIGKSIIRNNMAGSDGGGLTATGLIMSNSAVHNNMAGATAGGIRLTGSSVTHSLTHITVSSNSADSGGGIYLSTGNANLSGVTITNNEAVANNGGGIHNSGTITMRNSIVAGNVGGHPDCYGGTWASEGYNLIGLVTAECNWAGDTTNDLFNTALPALDPDLGTLQFNDHDNDGNDDQTPTHEPNEDSPAVNGANPAGCRAIGSTLPLTTDQRGAARSQQGRCDMGSAESPHEPATPPTAVAISGQQSAIGGQPISTFIALLLTLSTMALGMRNSIVNPKS